MEASALALELPSSVGTSLLLVLTDNIITLSILHNPSCDPTYSCCGTPLDKIDFVINSRCRGAIRSVSTSLLPSYTIKGWASTPPQFINTPTVLTVGIPGLAVNSQQAMETIFTLDPNNLACNTADKFFLNGEFWWSAYGSTATKPNACCGTQ